jgi:fructose-1,6-bisphosphatase/inositol monophosphatase family enzyme
MPFLKEFIVTGNQLSGKINSLFNKSDRVGYTGMGADGTLTSTLDSLCEDAIINRIEELNLPFNIVSEERGFVDRGFEDNIVIDPLDGTFNAENQIPAYSISLAIMGKDFNSINEALVFNLPTSNYFWAEKGKGAFRNNIQLPQTDKMTGTAVTYTMDPSSVPQYLIDEVTRLRIFGCASMELALLANGSLDSVAYLGSEKKLRNVDIAAGILLVRETGGTVLDEKGNILNMDLDVRSRRNMIALSHAKSKLIGAKER